jgi:hypothetical protein
MILPGANDDFARQFQSRGDESKFPVAMRSLIQVHKLHVDGRPWQLTNLREPGGGINLSFEVVSAWPAYTTGTCLQLAYRCGVPAQPRNGNRNGKPPKNWRFMHRSPGW